ncbi:MAG: competence protein ComK [Solobacterium sp.]|nr:competence protein ComK [Solobacterium sp.]
MNLLTERYITMRYDPEKKKTVCLRKDRIMVEEDRKPADILDDLCRRLGSGLKGRTDSAASLLNIVKKIPVLVSEDIGLIYFPVTSPANDPECLWICYNEVVDIYSYGNDRTEVVLCGGIDIIVNASRRSVRMQLKRCEEYIRKLNDNKREFFGGV